MLRQTKESLRRYLKLKNEHINQKSRRQKSTIIFNHSETIERTHDAFKVVNSLTKMTILLHVEDLIRQKTKYMTKRGVFLVEHTRDGIFCTFGSSYFKVRVRGKLIEEKVFFRGKN